MEFVSMQDIVCSSTQASQATSICIVRRQIQVKVAEVEAKAKVEVVERISLRLKLAKARKKVMNVFLIMPYSSFSILVMIIPTEFVSMQDIVCCSTLASQATSTCIAKLWKCIARLTIRVEGEGAAAAVVVAVRKMRT